MTTLEWIQVGSLVVEIVKILIPFGALFLIILIFKNEIKSVIQKGNIKVAAPGFSLETIQKQQEELGDKERTEIEALNTELETSRKAEKRLQELQEYTSRNKDTFFIGYHLEKTYRLIFPSQMMILNAMKNNSGEITSVHAQTIFKRTIWAQQFNITYQQFIDFMINSGLIMIELDRLLLTPLGNIFLDYLANNNISLKLPASDIIILHPID